MKDDLRCAEATVDFDDDKLKLLGWGGRKAPKTLEAPREGEGWIFSDSEIPERRW